MKEALSHQRWLRIAVTVVCVAFTSTALAQAPVAQPKTDAKTFVEGMHTHLDTLVAKHKQLDALHEAIGAQLVAHTDFVFMGQRILGKDTWSGLKDAQKTEFLDLLQGMLKRAYVQRFKPGHSVSVRYGKIKKGKKDGRVQVRTEIRVKRTRAEVWYSLRPVKGQWRIYDIVVDEASQLRTYRRSFRKALKKDGWKGLIDRMKKSASR